MNHRNLFKNMIFYKFRQPSQRPYFRYSQLVTLPTRVGVYTLFVFAAVGGGYVYGSFAPFLPLSMYLKFFTLPIALLGLMSIWAMPNRHHFGEKALYQIFVAFIFLWLVWAPYVSIIKLPGNPWMSPQRLLLFTCLSPMALVVFSVSTNAKKSLLECYKDNKAVFIGVVGVLLSQILSIPFSGAPIDSAASVFTNAAYTTLPFFITSLVYQDTLRIYSFVKILIISSIILALIGTYEALTEQMIWVTIFPAGWLDAGSEVMQSILKQQFKNNEIRVQGSSITPLEYGQLFSFIFPFSIYFIVERGHILRRLAGVGLMAITLYAAIISGTRLSLVGILVAGATYVFLFGVRYWINHRKSLIGPALLALYPAGMISLVIAVLTVPALQYRILGGGSTAASTDARFAQWEMGLPKIATHPIFGYGYIRSAEVLGYTNLSGGLTVDSYYLTLILETGLLGATAFLLWQIASIWTACSQYFASRDSARNDISRLGAAFASSFASFMVINLVLSQRSNHPLLYIFSGMLVALNFAQNRPQFVTFVKGTKSKLHY